MEDGYKSQYNAIIGKISYQILGVSSPFVRDRGLSLFVLCVGQSKRCYVCYSGEQPTSKSHCPPQSITAPYLTNSEACYGSCFVRAAKENPNVIFRGCTDLHPDIPPHLLLRSCRTYSNEQWCFCDTNLCNRASMDELKNPPAEEVEEEIIPEKKERIKAATIPNTNLNVSTERSNIITRTTHSERTQWFLKRVPPELKNHKNMSGGPEAYLNLPQTNGSSDRVNNIHFGAETTRTTTTTPTNYTNLTNSSNISTESDSCQYLPSLLFLVISLVTSLDWERIFRD
ncbi:hypothetical protein Ahia01_000010100 [Argonauta hians]